MVVLGTVAVVVALLVALVPGGCARVALGVRRPSWVAALAAPTSVAVASVTGLVTGLVGPASAWSPSPSPRWPRGPSGVLGSWSAAGRRPSAAPGVRVRRSGALVLGLVATAGSVLVSVLTWLGAVGMVPCGPIRRSTT